VVDDIIIQSDFSETPTTIMFTPTTIMFIYVAAKATYIHLLHGKIGFLGFFSALAL